jgi:hypothetical protein
MVTTGCGASPRATPSSYGTATPIPHAKTFASSSLHFSVSYDASKLSFGTDPGNIAAAEEDGLLQVNLSSSEGAVEILAQRVSRAGQAELPPLSIVRAALSRGDSRSGLAPIFFRMRLTSLHARSVEPTTLNGTPGYRATYVWTTGQGEYYVLNWKNSIVYRITASAPDHSAKAVWPTLNAVIQSFRAAAGTRAPPAGSKPHARRMAGLQRRAAG